MKRAFGRSIVIVVGLLAATQFACDAVFERAIRDRIEAPPSIDANDGDLHVVLCGTGSPLPDPDRAAPCTAVLAGGQFYLIDTGPGSWENLQLWGLPVDGVTGVLLTHFHSDHIGGLGETLTQAWIASGRGEPLPVFGPPGVEGVVDGFNQAYALDRIYRRTHHTPEFMPEEGGLGAASTIPLPPPGDSVVVIDKDGLKVTAFQVNHEPVVPSVGYRFEYGGRSVVISGDTAKSASLAANAKDADLLVHEALGFELIERASRIMAEAGQPRMSKLAADVLDYHTSPAQAKALADEAGVDTLVFTHNVPPLQNGIVTRLFTQGVDMTGVFVGDDGMHFTLEADGDGTVMEQF